MAGDLSSSSRSTLSSILHLIDTLIPSARVSISDAAVTGHLSRLKIAVIDLQAFLDDAEQRSLQEDSVRLWLGHLRDVAYDAEDLLDEFHYDHLQSLKMVPHQSSKKKRKEVSDPSPSSPTRHSKKKKLQTTYIDIKNPAQFREMVEKLTGVGKTFKSPDLVKKIVDKFLEVAERRYALGLRLGYRPSEPICEVLPVQTKHPQTQMLAYGRGGDREKVIDLLLLSAEGGKISVISLVGTGGIGKTTLARVIFDDRRVFENFTMRIWVRVCGDFDVGRLTQAVLEHMNGRPETRRDLDALQKDLKALLSQKKVMMVLDDVPISYEFETTLWDSFLAPFINTASTKIIVTTQSGMEVASSHSLRSYSVVLRPLTNDESWLLFRQYVFDGQDPQVDPDLIYIGKMIVSKCHGLPLAVKAIGSLLQPESNVKRWSDIIQSNLWDLDHPGTVIAPALRLSYAYMPSSLKPCFAYCSLFPRGYMFTKEQLTRLWIAQGFFDPREGTCVEDLSSMYFDELQRRSFIQYASSSDKNMDNMYYEMHDLIHDLSRFVSGGQTCPVNKQREKVNDVSNEVRHMFLASDEPGVPLDFPLRTYFYIHDCRWTDCLHSTLPHVLLVRLKCLRALEISCSGLAVLPETIGDLKHLRYLRLKAGIRVLPESVCNLYNLQTMDLSNCKYLQSLPKAFGNLISLRHLDLPVMTRPYSPVLDPHQKPGIGELGSLQTLVRFCVGRGGFRIEQLNGLGNLRKLYISGLRNMTNVEDAERANLENKRYLQTLRLDWRNPEDNNKDYLSQTSELLPGVDLERLTECVLDSLTPNINLSELVINGYDGFRFPRWLGDSTFANLTTVQLDGCDESNCEFLPPLGQLPSLRCLFISRMQGICYMGLEFCCRPENISTNVFPSLEELKFDTMLEWKLWNVVPDGGFPCLHKLTVNYCPKLRLLPTLPSLITLNISNCSELSETPAIPTLQSLEIQNCVSLASIPLHQNHFALQELNVRNCSWLASIIGLHNLVSLKCLSIISCPELRLSSDQRLPSMLQYVDIRDSPNLIEWCQRNSIQHKQFGVASSSQPTSCNVDGSIVYGRENDEKSVIKLLLSDDCRERNVSVIQIVAAAGIGKTTLIHLAYTNREVNETFEIKRWVSVPENFDLKGLIKAILESLTGMSCCLSELCELEEVLREELMEKRFLLVLDNFCNEDQNIWNSLMVYFTAGAKGSVVILTTRNKSPSNVTQLVHSYELDRLSLYNCWLIFKKIAFLGEDSNANLDLIEISREIVSKCNGVPLVAKALGGLLHYTAAERWQSTLSENGLWDIDNCSEAHTVLRLCYDCLPLCLKQCFVYCSLFPKNYIFEKDHLVRLWLSQGFIWPEHGKRIEDIGIQYFDELFLRSFFQYSPIYDAKEGKFMMHDLFHDLAGSVSLSEIECSRIEYDRLSTIPENIDHASFVPWRSETMIPYEPFKEPRNLHTFLLINRSVLQPDANLFYVENIGTLNEIFMNFRSLRTLDLSLTNIKELPSSVGNLTNLCYLGLNNTNIKRLPESICSLHNLETLELQRCNRLIELPKDTKSLVNLRHLIMWKEVGFALMPLGIGQLTSLQILSTFHVGGDKQHSTVRELKDLVSLRGVLCIGGLENVMNGKDAEDADIKSKEHLRTLTLQWYDNGLELDDNEREETAGDVLQSLKPHVNLEELFIRDYFGDLFPTWMGDASFSKLLSITIDNCYQCSVLPPLGLLPSLRYLSLRNINCVQFIGHEICGSDSLVMTWFPSLEILRLWEMYELEEWGGVIDGDFPRLRSLSISRCLKLRRLPCFTFLSELLVHSCPHLPNLSTLPSLESLKIEDFQNLKSLSLPSRLPSLRMLEINNCKQLSSVMGLGHLTSTEQLKITNCPKLQFSPTQLMPCRLQVVHIHHSCTLLREWCPYGFIQKPGTQGHFVISHQQVLAQVTAQDHSNQSQSAEAVDSMTQSTSSGVTMVEDSHSGRRSQPSALSDDKPAGDGYSWQKYRQKQDIEYSTGYYRCIYPRCSARKRKQYSLAGHGTEIIYTGNHIHLVSATSREIKLVSGSDQY